MAASDKPSDESLYPIAVLIDELKNEDIQVSVGNDSIYFSNDQNGDKILVINLHNCSFHGLDLIFFYMFVRPMTMQCKSYCARGIRCIVQ